jgi:hypothetical protein
MTRAHAEAFALPTSAYRLPVLALGLCGSVCARAEVTLDGIQRVFFRTARRQARTGVRRCDLDGRGFGEVPLSQLLEERGERRLINILVNSLKLRHHFLRMRRRSLWGGRSHAVDKVID